jgi:hypothetical protein
MERFGGRQDEAPMVRARSTLHASLPPDWGDFLKAGHHVRMLLRQSRSQ